MVQREKLDFMVPLYVKDGIYQITVKAYKGDKMVTAKPQLLTVTVKGSVLNQIRTRLR